MKDRSLGACQIYHGTFTENIDWFALHLKCVKVCKRKPPLIAVVAAEF